MSKIVVIGANHAGTACINFLTDLNKNNEVTVFDRNTNISFLGCGMALWIGGQIKGSDGLFYSSKEKLEEKGAKVNMESEVEKIDFDAKKVMGTHKDGSKFEEKYDKLVVATGSLPVWPSIKGMELENVEKVKIFQDAQKIIGKLDSVQNVAVIGAGYIGVELAEAFKRHGKTVTLIDTENTCLSNHFDKEFSSLMDENIKSHGIQLALGEKVVEMKGNGKIESIVTDKNEYKCDMAVVCVGFKPNSSLCKGKLKMDENGAILVNLKQETSEKDVYAVGDCAVVEDNSLGKKAYIALASNAVRSGIVAAHNVSGIPLDSVGVQGSNGINVYDLKMVSTGLTVKRAKSLGIDEEHTDFEDWQRPLFMESGNEKVKIRIVYEKSSRRIIGAQLASRYDISMGIHMFSLAIQEKLTIDRLKLLDIFFLPHFNQPYNYITMAAISAK